MPEIVEDGVTGILVPPGDAAALAEAMVDLLRDPARAAAMGRAGYAKTLAMHTWGHVGERIAGPLLARERGGTLDMEPGKSPMASAAKWRP
jgi:alpha-maltose-1-phosphate synthase